MPNVFGELANNKVVVCLFKIAQKKKMIGIIISDTGSMEKQQENNNKIKVFPTGVKAMSLQLGNLEKKIIFFIISSLFCGKISFQSSRMIYLVLLTVTNRHLMSISNSIIL